MPDTDGSERHITSLNAGPTLPEMDAKTNGKTLSDMKV